jgi:hypothetical protein
VDRAAPTRSDDHRAAEISRSGLAFSFEAGSRPGYGRVVLPLAVTFEVNPALVGGEARRVGCDCVARVLSFGQRLAAASHRVPTAGFSRSRSM